MLDDKQRGRIVNWLESKSWWGEILDVVSPSRAKNAYGKISQTTQPDYSWQVNPNQSKHCTACGGTGRMRKEPPDHFPDYFHSGPPGHDSLLEWEKKVLLRKLGRCHEALQVGIHTIQEISRPGTHWEGCEKVHPVCAAVSLMREALTDKGGEDAKVQSIYPPSD